MKTFDFLIVHEDNKTPRFGGEGKKAAYLERYHFHTTT